MTTDRLVPDYVFESSWEVCNKVGGIYTVLSTRAKTLQEMFPDHIIFIGPDVWGEKPCPYFQQDDKFLEDFQRECAFAHLGVKVGRWDIPGRPIAVLVDFKPYYERKNEIYTRLWEDFQVDSLDAYGDYDEASMFSYAAGLVAERLYLFFSRRSSRGYEGTGVRGCERSSRGYEGTEVRGYENSFVEGEEGILAPSHPRTPAPSNSILAPRENAPRAKRFVYHANEWMTGLGLLYIKKVVPQMATIFTTHATSIGRSIAGNNKPLYDYLTAYNGDQMAQELNMQSKHSIEKQTAHHCDCFTTVSDITASECRQLLDKPVDVVLPNGFDNSFVPKGAAFSAKRRKARQRLIEMANDMLGTRLTDDVLMVSTSGRFEYRNKGIDVFIESMHRLKYDSRLKHDILAFVMVPGCERQSWHEGRVTMVFLPYYLTGFDGQLGLTYYDALIGNDLCIYPSYYEPWGYTPLEAIAFKIPCITTDLAGFGLWAEGVVGRPAILEHCGVEVVHRTDYNFTEVCDAICNAVTRFSALNATEVKAVRANAAKLSEKALWSKFIRHYEEAYDVALRKNPL